MMVFNIFKYEWKHFSRSTFKVVAILLFTLATVYGFYNGYQLYNVQTTEISRIQEQITEEQDKVLSYYDNNEKGPSDRPWVDVTTPFWAVWNASQYSFKTPSPLLIYSVGQAEQYGYYKKVTFWSSPYDADMAEEIANPERLQMGLLDYTFALIFLLPLLLLICFYDIKGKEFDTGVLSLITVQSGETKNWLWARLLFYATLIILLNALLIALAGGLTSVFSAAISGFLSILLWSTMYIIIWTIAFGLLIQFGKSSIENTLKMIGLWLLVAFLIPGAVHQWVSTTHPTNLMTDFIDSQRDDRTALFDLPDSLYQEKLNKKFPEIANSVVMNDSTKISRARNYSASALANELTKESLVSIENSFKAKNNAISNSFWFNPSAFFQNKFNRISETHFDDYQDFRNRIQSQIDNQIELMVIDLWNDKTVDKATYLNYIKSINDL